MNVLVEKVSLMLPGYAVRSVTTPRGPCIEASKGGHVAMLSPTCIRNAPSVMETMKTPPSIPGHTREWTRGYLVIAIDHVHS